MPFKNLCLIFIALTLCACEGENDVRQYSVHNEQLSVRASSGANFNWSAPSFWHYRTAQNPMQLAIFIAPENSDKFAENPYTNATVSLSFLKGPSGNLKSNINRWQKQIKLPETNLSNSQIRLLETTLGDVQFVKLINLEKNEAILAAIYERLDGTLFVKMRGPVQTIEQQMQAFVTFVEGLSFK